MSSRGAPRGRGAGFSRGRGDGNFGFRGRARSYIHPQIFANNNTGRGGFQPSYGPPAAVLGTSPFSIMQSHAINEWEIIEMGSFVHACEGEIVCESINPKVPKFNAPIYLENKVSELVVCEAFR